MQGTNDPFERMEAMFEQMRRNAFGSMVHQPRQLPGGMASAEVTQADGMRSTPAHDTALTLEETDEGYHVVADVPGFEKEEIRLTYGDGVLRMEGSHEVSDEQTYRQRTVAESIRVPGDVVAEDVSATYRNGVLEVSLPADAESSHEVQIDVE